MSCVHKTKHRVLSVLLSLVMLLTFAIPAFAETVDLSQLTGENPNDGGQSNQSDIVFFDSGASDDKTDDDGDGFIDLLDWGNSGNKEKSDDTDKPAEKDESAATKSDVIHHTVVLDKVTVAPTGGVVNNPGISTFALTPGAATNVTETRQPYPYVFAGAFWLDNPITSEWFPVISHVDDGSTKSLYCLEANKAISGADYTAVQTWNSLDSATQQTILKILIAGEKNPSNLNGVMATQTLIWEAMENFYRPSYTVGSKGYVYQGVLMPHTGPASLGSLPVNPPSGTLALYDSIWAAAQSVTISENSLMYLTKAGSQTLVTYVGAESGQIDPYAIKIIKKDANGGALLPDAIFSVTGPGGFSRTGLKTGSDGSVTVRVPVAGAYTVTETTPPPNYENAATPSKPVTVTTAHVIATPVEVVFENTKKSSIPEEPETPPGDGGDARGQVTIVKKDGNGDPLAGAIFNISIKFSDGTTHVNSAFQVNDGANTYSYFHPSGNTAAATVTVTEVTAPLKYIADPTPKTITINPTWADGDGKITVGDTGSDIELTFVNEPEEASLTIYKYQKGSIGISLPGAHFSIRTADGGPNWTDTFITGADGTYRIALPRAGTYIITEEKAPDGYVIDVDGFGNNQITVEVAKGENKTIEVPNDKKGALIIIKRDAQDKSHLPGATFEVTNIDTHEKKSGVTGADGSVTFTDLTPGDYRVEEMSPPQFYELDENPVKTTKILDGSNETITMYFDNEPWTGLRIIKVDSVTGERLKDGIFGVYSTAALGMDGYPTGPLISEFNTNANGEIVIQKLTPGFYTIVEHQAPYGYAVGEDDVRVIQIKPEDIDRTLQVIFRNDELPKLRIIKRDSKDNVLLPGATFQLRHEDGALYDDVTTGPDGTVLVERLPIGWYTITEMRSPTGYLMPTDAIAPVELVAGKTSEVTVYNDKMPALTILKVDGATKLPLPNATFKVTKQGAMEYTTIKTDDKGVAKISGLEAGHYIVEEIYAPIGYVKVETPFTVELKPGTDTEITIENTKVATLKIKKIDNLTKEPLRYAEFTILKPGGQVVFTGFTDENGEIFLPEIEPGDYILREVGAPDGYEIITVEQNIVIHEGEDLVVTVPNNAINPLYIQKIDSVTSKPLGGAVFTVSNVDGGFIGEYRTGVSGYATVTGLKTGYYVVTEVKAPEGYIMQGSPKTVRIETGKPATVTFENTAKSSLQIFKVDSKTNDPLVGVTIKVTKASGELVGSYKTGVGGIILIDDLEPGAYVAVETATIAGYELDTTPQTVEIKTGKNAELTFKNEPLAGLQIRKVDLTTNAPLQGVDFEVRKANGQLVGNYTTGATGTIFIDKLEAGFYTVTETSALEGYKADYVPRTIELKTGEQAVVTYKNAKYPMFTIKKVDSESGQPLAGAKFKLMDSSYRELGVISTTEKGLISVSGLDEGTYYVQEIQAPNGYVLDATAREVALKWGQTTVLEVKNVPLGTLRLQKVDSVTGKPLPKATFNLYDSKNNLLGEYVTDNTGMIVFGKELAAGKYFVKEVKAPNGYVLNSDPITVEIKAGSTTELTVKNEPETGRIQITKVSSDRNNITKDKKGELLAGAVFEIYNEQKEVVDRITTDSRGLATSKDLPLGKYAIKEVTAPQHYYTDGKPFYAEIKVNNDLIKFKVENIPADISVTVQKRGNFEAISGSTTMWEFYNIENTSNIELDDFYWHDLIPTDAVRAISMSTGTWNERLTYTAYYRTNLYDNYRVLKSNLSSEVNNELSLTSASLGLKLNEYVTDVKLVFGTVQPGFREVKRPTLTAAVLPLPDGYTIVNRTDVGGMSDGEWTYAKDSWVTIVLGFARGKLPKTGESYFTENVIKYQK